jgi:transcriptional regulator with XRE-family HTH domain
MADTFARLLTALREGAGLSQYEVSKRSGLPRQTVSRLEMGSSVPSWPTVQALARALGVRCTAFEDDAPLPAVKGKRRRK